MDLDLSRPLELQPGSNPTRSDLTFYRGAMAVLWTIVIMTLCWLPGTVVQTLEGDSAWLKVPDLDKVVHAGIFVIFSILWARLGSKRRRLAWIALGGFGLAVLTEVVQNLPIIGRDGEVSDAILDAAGVVAGLAATPLVEPLFRFLETRIFREKELSHPVAETEVTEPGTTGAARGSK